MGHRALWAYGSSGAADQHFFDPAGNWLGNYGEYSLLRLGDRYLVAYESSETYLYHVNALGSTSMFTNHAGGAAEDMLFYPWGDVWQSWGTGGYAFADLPLYDGNTNTGPTTNRFYSMNVARWHSPDPAGKAAVELDDPQTWNMYAYVRNNPATLTDPSGLASDTWWTRLVNAVKDEWISTAELAGSLQRIVVTPLMKSQPHDKQPSWDPSKPLPDDPSKLGPDWTRNPEHKDPNGEEYINDKTGDKVEWNKGRPGQPGWRGEDHWHHTPPGGERSDDHYKPGQTIKEYAPVAIGFGIAAGVVQTIIETAPEWIPILFAIP